MLSVKLWNVEFIFQLTRLSVSKFSVKFTMAQSGILHWKLKCKKFTKCCVAFLDLGLAQWFMVENSGKINKTQVETSE